ncbi:MAG: nicotinate-nucleotide--dimethylbenzimidazole phosphoribosyltransferase [Desulfobacterota bacterium]|nr:nicotinate-nucleotide--dimethylbenzimidazole phosphoribosyltransferase [Thermodesulfobacteriota bacterium]
MDDVSEIIAGIKPIDQDALDKAQDRLDRLAIPRGSLGRLMSLGRRYAGIRRDPMPYIRRKQIFTFAGDHGVAAEGVSAFPQQVTREMVFNFMRGGAGINVLASHAGAGVTVVDIGVDYDFPRLEGLVVRKIRRGTGNIASEPAMTRDEALSAVRVGIDLACGAARDGVDLFGTGDMGIGNTTPSSAIIAAFSGLEVEKVTGRGTGINDQALKKKIEVIKRAMTLHRPDPTDPLDVLAKVGGLEIAGICGLIIGAAAMQRGVVIDGFISGAAAVVACELNPLIKDYIFAAHLSVEHGHRVMLERMGLTPLFDLEMRLGEGTGAALGMWLVEAGVKVLTEMLTFEEAGVTEGTI